MHYMPGGQSRLSRIRSGPPRFARLSPHESGTAELLHGCPVVTAGGEQIGAVDHLMIDVLSHRLRYVILAPKKNSALIAIPWHALYFDAALARLVFYTLT